MMKEQKTVLASIHLVVGWLGLCLLFAPFILGLIDLVPKVEIYSLLGKNHVFIWNIACLVVFAILTTLLFLRANPWPRKIIGLAFCAYFAFWNLLMIFDNLH